ncbi:MAG: hypothetical protein ACYC6A_09090 [Armatimonadota bacterium]
MPDQVRMVVSPIELKEGEMGRTRNGRVYVGLANKQYIEVAGKVTGTTVVQPMTSPSATVRPGGAAGGNFSRYQGVLRVTNGQLQGDSTTDTLPEGANQYFTETRARAAVQPGGHLYGASGANGNAYAITLTPAITALAAGLTVRVRAGAANTGAATLQVNGLPAPAAAIKKQHDQDLAAGDIEAGQLFTASWDGTVWQLQSPPAGNTADAVTADAAAFSGTLSAADTTVQAALETLDGHDHQAGAIATDTTGFNILLSSQDDTIQKALDKLDDHDHPNNGSSGGRYFMLHFNDIWSSNTAGADFWTLDENGVNHINLNYKAFSSLSQQHVEATRPLPSDYDGGTLIARFYWYANTSNTGNVTWGIQGICFSDGETLDRSWGTGQTVTDTFQGTDKVHITDATAAITLAGTPAPNKLAQWRVYRTAGGLAAGARLIAVLIEY